MHVQLLIHQMLRHASVSKWLTRNRLGALSSGALRRRNEWRNDCTGCRRCNRNRSGGRRRTSSDGPAAPHRLVRARAAATDGGRQAGLVGDLGGPQQSRLQHRGHIRRAGSRPRARASSTAASSRTARRWLRSARRMSPRAPRPTPRRSAILPGVPRDRSIEHPFQIVQTPDSGPDAVRVRPRDAQRLPELAAPERARSTGGWATRAGRGRATRWWWTPTTSTKRRGSTAPATSTATRCHIVERTRSPIAITSTTRPRSTTAKVLHAAVDDEPGLLPPYRAQLPAARLRMLRVRASTTCPRADELIVRPT